MNNRIALGTVQFGQPYGISNTSGVTNVVAAQAILSCARSAGMDTLDTAIAYGESEQRLGEIGVGQWLVISKLPAVPDSCADVAGWVRESFHESVARLRISRLHGLLLHQSQQLLGSKGPELYRSLLTLKEQGAVEKIGISIYSPSELDALWPNYRFDVVQAPLSIIDRRLATSGWLNRLHQAGTEVHIRSVFLQGLLLMDSVRRPSYFNRWQALWDQWHGWLQDHSLSALQGCLGFVLPQTEISRIIVGVDSPKQLQEILASLDMPAIEPPLTLANEDADLIEPFRWRVS